MIMDIDREFGRKNTPVQVTQTAEVVHRGSDGSAHFLSSSAGGSLLIITDPAVGVVKIPFDGPCRLTPRSPNLPAGYDAVDYESVGVSGSTMVSVHPGEMPSSYSVAGVCFACVAGPHDYSLWPVCPGDRVREDAGSHSDISANASGPTIGDKAWTIVLKNSGASGWSPLGSILCAWKGPCTDPTR